MTEDNNDKVGLPSSINDAEFEKQASPSTHKPVTT